MNDKLILWILRVLVAVLFVVSAISKIFPIEGFEKLLVGLGFVDWCLAPVLARTIIIVEIFLGIAILQNHFLKKIILPSITVMLLGFCIHLSFQVYWFGNQGNCGCMGELLPMSPMAAIFKNIITISIVGYIYIKTKAELQNRHRFLIALLGISSVFVLSLRPIRLNQKYNETDQVITKNTVIHDTIFVHDTLTISVKENKKNEVKSKVASGQNIAFKGTLPRIKSEFSQFENGKTLPFGDVDKDLKIICIFNTTCDHCMDVAKQLSQLGHNNKIPPIRIIFWSESNAKGEDLDREIKSFFDFAGNSYPYVLVETGSFFRLLGNAPFPPRIAVLDNGNIIGDYNSNNFNSDAFLNTIKR